MGHIPHDHFLIVPFSGNSSSSQAIDTDLSPLSMAQFNELLLLVDLSSRKYILSKNTSSEQILCSYYYRENTYSKLLHLLSVQFQSIEVSLERIAKHNEAFTAFTSGQDTTQAVGPRPQADEDGV